MGPGRPTYVLSSAVIPESGTMPGFGRYPNGDVIVTCWCGRRYVRVTNEVMLATLTDTCGHEECVAP
jgi:hypothetical protein